MPPFMHSLRTLSLYLVLFLPLVQAQTPEQTFNRLCSGCHGAGLTGTDRGPSLLNRRSLRRRSEAQIHDLIRDGAPGGMPAFALPEAELAPLARYIRSFNASAFDVAAGGDVAAGEALFFGTGKCGSCHMVHGRGGVNGPDLSGVARELTRPELEQSLLDPASRTGVRNAEGCPGWAFCSDGRWGLVTVKLKSGETLRGYARAQGKHDLQLQVPAGGLRLLNDSQYSSVTREQGSAMPAFTGPAAQWQNLVAYLARQGGIPLGPVPSATPVVQREMDEILTPAMGEWPTHNGALNGNRHSSLSQITADNGGQLQAKWMWSTDYQGLETTPLVADGVMYVTAPNQVCALDAAAGRTIWCYSRPRNSGATIAGDAAKGANRGAALLGRSVFFATDDAHLISINRVTGALMWDIDMREGKGAFGSTGAPLVVGDLVIAGVAGGDGPLRGYVTAYKASSGEQVWRFFTIPKRGEKGSETWKGSALEVGGGATWTSGSYDAETGLLYWPTGNPYPDTDGDEREGDNLYTNCVLALDPKTGVLKWHYQFTPHDLHDWDATEPFVLVNAMFQGRDRKLLLQANRNGFFYVLDRVTGEFLLGKPFVRKLTWASGIGADGRPVLLEGNQPTKGGTKTCPAVRGATNWYSTAFNPTAGLFYTMAVEDCNIYQKTKAGGFEPYRDPKDPAEKFLRAIDYQTGRIVWEVPQVGAPESNYSGVLSTAGGVVFYGETGGSFAAVDGKSGATLWHFNTGNPWKASPITYMVNGRQYVAIASGGNIVAFGL